MQAITVSLCTSRPAQRSTIVSMPDLPDETTGLVSHPERPHLMESEVRARGAAWGSRGLRVPLGHGLKSTRTTRRRGTARANPFISAGWRASAPSPLGRANSAAIDAPCVLEELGSRTPDGADLVLGQAP